jgi:hypothetical protein
MFPKKYGHFLFGAILSGLMSLLISGISTFRAVGLAPNVVMLWLSSWLAAWCIAFPAVLVVAPFARKTADRLVRKD